MAIIILPSCKNADTAAKSDSTCSVAINADSLAALWNNAWNTKDSVALREMIAEKALVIDEDWTAEGVDSIFAKWIKFSLPVISNVKTMPLKVNSSCCCVSMTGFYTLDYTSKEGVKPTRGNFTFIWMLQEDKTYKLELMHMTEFKEKTAK
jgi:hypothetical protein